MMKILITVTITREDKEENPGSQIILNPGSQEQKIRLPVQSHTDEAEQIHQVQRVENNR